MSADPLPPSAATSERIVLRTVAERRRRVIRSILSIIAITMGIVVLSVLGRDRQSIEGCRERMEFACKGLQALSDKGEVSPFEMPLPEDSGPSGAAIRDHVYYNWQFSQSVRTEVGVCCCQEPHGGIFGEPGRHVITYHVRERRYELTWMDEAEFSRRAEELGLRVRVGP